MATYFLLMTLTPAGQSAVMKNGDFLLQVENEIDIPEVEMLGVYAVLGQYDFVTMVEAPNNEAMARFSIELGVRAGVHITTLPVIPTSKLEVEDEGGGQALYESISLEPESEETGLG